MCLECTGTSGFFEMVARHMEFLHLRETASLRCDRNAGIPSLTARETDLLHRMRREKRGLWRGGGTLGVTP